MDAQQNASILAELLASCNALARRLHDEFEGLPYGKPDTAPPGLLGATRQKVDASGNAAFSPWESTPLRTLALNPEIATPIAERHGVTVPNVLSIGALSLPDSRENGFMFASGASTHFARMAIQNFASYLTANEGWGKMIELAMEQGREWSKANIEKSALEASNSRFSAKIKAQETALAKGRKVANENRTAHTNDRRSEAHRIFLEWRQHPDNITADKKTGYAHVAKCFNGWGFKTSKGGRYTGGTVSEYFRAPRKREKRA